MTDKAYIVANEQQEKEVLRIMEQQGYTWNDGDIPTHCMPSHFAQLTFPYVLTNRNFIGWLSIDDARLVNFKVLYDGRKEEQMSDKYVVSQEFMNELEEWKAGLNFNSEFHFVSYKEIKSLPEKVQRWRNFRINTLIKSNDRSIAIIRWVNGEDVFEVEKPKKWVVRSKDTDEDGEYGYVSVGTHDITITIFNISIATKFDTKEEAESWANDHQEVVEVEE